MSKIKRRDLSVITAEIKANLKRQTADIVTLGGLLIEAKKQVDHGEWLPWLKREFSLSDRSAQRYMKAYKFAVKYDIVADLNMSPSALYLLIEEENDFPPVVITACLKHAAERRVGKDDVWEIYRIYRNEKKIRDWEEAQCRVKPTEARRKAEASEPKPQPEPKHEPEIISKNAMLALKCCIDSYWPKMTAADRTEITTYLTGLPGIATAMASPSARRAEQAAGVPA